MQVEVYGLKSLGRKFAQAAKVGAPPVITEALIEGAEEIRDQIKHNILVEQHLYDEGDMYESVRLDVSPYAISILVDFPGVVHEYGLEDQEITDKQRKFFWAKWYETGEKMWKCLALSESYTIPPRPFVRPAFEDKHHSATVTIGLHIAKKFLSIFKGG